jgi:glycosyltransferase involved in cell wall biosynthesis
MATVIKHVPRAHLLLIGDCDHTDDILGNVQQLIRQYSLERHVSMLGRRDDVADILSGCDIGVLSSSSEGLPLSLLEYGIAGLPSVATCVGQCGDVLDNGEAGLIVPPRAPDKLAEALETLLSIPERRIILGERLQRRVTEVYNAQRAVDEVSQLYGAILTECKVIQPKPNASGHGRTSVLVDRRYPG